jgi:hypothetical protein
MTLAEEGNRIRLEILRLGDSKARRYPAALQEKILDWVDRSKHNGMRERECADLLEVPCALCAPAPEVILAVLRGR